MEAEKSHHPPSASWRLSGVVQFSLSPKVFEPGSPRAEDRCPSSTRQETAEFFLPSLEASKDWMMPIHIVESELL